MQDDVPRPVPGHLRGSGAPDYISERYAFEKGFNRLPDSWADFVHGTAYLARESAAEKLRIADAIAATKDSKGWAQWVRDHQTLSGG